MYLTYSAQAQYHTAPKRPRPFTSLPFPHLLTHLLIRPLHHNHPNHHTLLYHTSPYLISLPSISPSSPHYVTPPPLPRKKQEMSTPPLLRRRTIILTIGAVAITAVGAYTGAQLKSDLQAQRQKEISGEGIDGRIRR